MPILSGLFFLKHHVHITATLCRKCPDCSIIARNAVKNDQISGQLDIPGICDNPVKIIPGLHHSRKFKILTGLVHHIPVKHVLSGKDSPPNQFFAPRKNLL
jgi:hypothetical protein